MTEQTATRNPESRRISPLWLAAVFPLTAMLLFVLLPRLGQFVGIDYGMSFADGYDLIANNLVQGNGFRVQANTSETMMREPGYPVFLAAAFKLGGYSLSTVRWANWLLSIGVGFLLYRLALRITNDVSTSFLATLLFLLWPATLVSEARGGVEILFILVVLAFILLVHSAVTKGGLWRYAIAGIALGLVVQVRSTPMVFPFFLFIYLLFFGGYHKKWGHAVLNMAVLVCCMVLVMTPWIIRNYRLVHHIVPTATVQGVALQEGQYTCLQMTSNDDFYMVQRQAGLKRAAIATKLGLAYEGAYYYQLFYDPQQEWFFNKYLLDSAKNQYIQHPALLVGCSTKNLFNYWFLGKTRHATLINLVVQIPLLAIATWGFVLLWRRNTLSAMGIPIAFMFCIIAVHLPTIAHARHSVPLIPFLAIPASVAILSLVPKPSTQVA